MEQSVPKCQHIKFRRRGITQRKAYNKSRSYLASNRVKGVHVVKWKQFCEKISYVPFRNTTRTFPWITNNRYYAGMQDQGGNFDGEQTPIQRLRWSRGSVLAFSTQVRVFKPSRSRRIFKGEKILNTPSFGGEVKPSVPCRRFAACKRTINVPWKSCI
jgi:hypothetical protein